MRRRIAARAQPVDRLGALGRADRAEPALAVAAAEKAVTLDPNDAGNHWVLGHVLAYERRWPEIGCGIRDRTQAGPELCRRLGDAGGPCGVGRPACRSASSSSKGAAAQSASATGTVGRSGRPIMPRANMSPPSRRYARKKPIGRLAPLPRGKPGAAGTHGGGAAGGGTVHDEQSAFYDQPLGRLTAFPRRRRRSRISSTAIARQDCRNDRLGYWSTSSVSCSSVSCSRASCSSVSWTSSILPKASPTPSTSLAQPMMSSSI